MQSRIFKIRCSAIGKIMGNSKKAGELSQTCKTYLETWYANDNEEIHSKYFAKGNTVENELIDFMAEQLGYGMAQKNQEYKEDEWFTGTCDVVLNDAIVDVKAPWNRKTLLDSVSSDIDTDYEYQLQGYCHLYNKPKGILFYGLMDTPSDIAYTDEDVTYSHLPDNERWTAFEVTYSEYKIKDIIQRVIQCREYLANYESLIKSKLGKIN